MAVGVVVASSADDSFEAAPGADDTDSILLLQSKKTLKNAALSHFLTPEREVHKGATKLKRLGYPTDELMRQAKGKIGKMSQSELQEASMLQTQQDADEAFEQVEEADAMYDEGDTSKFSFVIHKPTVDVRKPMPVLIGSYRETDLKNSGNGLGHATVIWFGGASVGKQRIGQCKWNHPHVKLFGKILDAIEEDPDLDKDRIVATGFSLTGKATLFFTCHADRLTGIYVSGAGFEIPNPGPPCGTSLEDTCSSVKVDGPLDTTKCEACQNAVLKNCEVNRQCMSRGAYPCYTKKPFAVVASTGDKDYKKYELDLLYNATKAEGLDARYQLWRFGHKKPKELGAVIMGTFKFGYYCSGQCGRAVIKCTQDAPWKNLNWCLAWTTKYRPKECPKFCVPYEWMLRFAEKPLLKHIGVYGRVQKVVQARPAESKCNYDDFKK